MGALEERHTKRRFLYLGLLALAVLLLSLLVGRYPEPYWMPPPYLWRDELARRLVLHLRLPRILTVFLMGVALLHRDAQRRREDARQRYTKKSTLRVSVTPLCSSV
jgi:ABC-type cobalamin transport system permease subunit